MSISSPIYVANLNRWFDASQLVELSDGDPIDSWMDMCLNNPANQSGTERPIFKAAGTPNGGPTVAFNTEDQHLVLPGTININVGTVFIVAKRAPGERTYMGDIGTGTHSSNFSVGVGVNEGYRMQNNSASGILLSDPLPIGPDNFEIATFIRAGNNSTMFQNGVQVRAPANFPSGTIVIKGIGRQQNSSLTRHFAGGEIAEILVFLRELTPKEREDVEEYLYNKWFVGTFSKPTTYYHDFADDVWTQTGWANNFPNVWSTSGSWDIPEFGIGNRWYMRNWAGVNARKCRAWNEPGMVAGDYVEFISRMQSTSTSGNQMRLHLNTQGILGQERGYFVDFTVIKLLYVSMTLQELQ